MTFMVDIALVAKGVLNDMDSDVIMAYADELNPQLWRSSCPLIFYAIVEMHRPERVVRQLGMRQNVPESTDTQDMSLHQISRKNHTGADWSLQHIQYITRWQRRYDTVVQRPPISNRKETERGYWEWYYNITRNFVSSSTNRRVESGYQPGEAPMLQVVKNEVNALETLCRSNHRILKDIVNWWIDLNMGYILSIERHDIEMDIAGPSIIYPPQPPQDYYVPQPPQDYYILQPSQDEWFQSTPYMPNITQDYSLDLGLGINQAYAQGYNISPIPFPSFGAYRDNVESSSATTSSRFGGDENEAQNEPVQNVGEEIRRPRRQRHRRHCGMSGHFLYL
ncbi:UNVERIFIED_CONTAM: hypothetical protein Sindi_0928200 [Sesamum indicum]